MNKIEAKNQLEKYKPSLKNFKYDSAHDIISFVEFKDYCKNRTKELEVWIIKKLYDEELKRRVEMKWCPDKPVFYDLFKKKINENKEKGIIYLDNEMYQNIYSEVLNYNEPISVITFEYIEDDFKLKKRIIDILNSVQDTVNDYSVKNNLLVNSILKYVDVFEIIFEKIKDKIILKIFNIENLIEAKIKESKIADGNIKKAKVAIEEIEIQKKEIEKYFLLLNAIAKSINLVKQYIIKNDPDIDTLNELFTKAPKDIKDYENY